MTFPLRRGVAAALAPLVLAMLLPSVSNAQVTKGLEPESVPYETALDVAEVSEPASLGPTPVANVRLVMDGLGLGKLFGNTGIRFWGWAEGGYTASSSGSGLMSVQTRQNRYGNQLLFNQVGLVLQRGVKQNQVDFGFNIRYFAGADAALGQPKGGIGDAANTYFSQDFRDLSATVHIPGFKDGGLDIKVGRQNTIIGYSGFLSPFRPFYSNDYQFFYSQDGAFTGLLTTLTLNSELNISNGLTLCANTFFTMRNDGYFCYIGQINYWLNHQRRTRLTGSTYLGRQTIFAAPGLGGTFVTMGELRVQHQWNDRFFQVVQSNFGWDSNTPVGTASWFGLYTIGILNLSRPWDFLFRLDFFNDDGGTRTGINTAYSELTLGVNWHPVKFLEVRPEVRGDLAGREAYGTGGGNNHKSQVIGVLSAMVKF